MGTPIHIHGLLAKAESVYGTDAAPAAANDGVLITDPLHTLFTVRHEFPNLAENDASGGLIPGAPGKPRGRVVDFRIPWRVRGAGVAYGDPSPVSEADPLFRSCPLVQSIDTTVGSEKVEYALASLGHESATLWGYALVAEDAIKLMKLVGCRSTFTWRFDPGQLGMVEFRGLGLMVEDPSEVASLPAIQYNASEKPAAVGGGIQIGGSWTPGVVISSELALNANPQVIESGNGADGIAEISVQDRFTPTYTLEARTEKQSVFNPDSIVTNRTAQAIAQRLGASGATGQYKRLSAVVTNAYLEDYEHIDHKGHAGWRLPFRLTDLIARFD